MPFRPIHFFILLMLGNISVFAQTPEKYELSTDSTVNRLAGARKVYYATRINKRP